MSSSGIGSSRSRKSPCLRIKDAKEVNIDVLELLRGNLNNSAVNTNLGSSRDGGKLRLLILGVSEVHEAAKP